MIIDNFLLFSGTSNGATAGITSGPYTDAPLTGTTSSSNVVDLGVINGIPTSLNGGGARDIGIGDTPALELLVVVTAAFVGGTSLQAVLQGAPDNGSGAPGAFFTLWTGPAVALANLTQGAYLANVDVPRVIAPNPLPRFLRMQYVAVGTFTAGGNVEAAIVLDRFDPVIGPTGLNSGYPPGIVINN
jgi:hypothetical protein